MFVGNCLITNADANNASVCNKQEKFICLLSLEQNAKFYKT